MRYPCGHGRDDIPVECVVCQLEALRAERDRLKALLAEARPMVYSKANEFSEHEDVTLERQSVLARIDKEIAS